ncbi:DNA topoisomerase 3-alpha [Trachymyrmex septentrionalis]|uniref:DNA topoisomerase 3-alpha n=1 Tax=Trachymyrmex septentrionalis TaxID=34720 RepID=A0A195F569_9HYME|nr:DNA topoisomerase 3-alpha [Trachymyrmex septentrionalis]
MVSRPDKNSDSNFSRPSTSKDNWDNPSTNVMCNCNQPAQKMTVYRDSPKKGRLFYRCPNGPTSTCNFFKWADKNDNGIPEKPNAKKPKLIGGGRKCGFCGVEGNEEKESLKNSSFCYLFFSLESDQNFYQD